MNTFTKMIFSSNLKNLAGKLSILITLTIFAFHVDAQPAMKKVSKPDGEQLMSNFKEKNAEATLLGQAFTKAQLEQLIQQFPDCNAFNVYFAIDKSGTYTGENQYMLLLAPAVFDAGKGTLKYVNDPGHDSSLYVPSILCPDQCGLMQNK
ncbi:MAG: hypothetical protein IPP38_06315 [Bacteroidetes bacterium]|nr:hypothetical protein [Bacteroidota bacterium]